ncbi:hypothetical protein LOK49_LG09G02077 [Camellia lanceoleosa]|uniref:Uncharacterized protein n=1 Tax=Camellia lanceoleosa TaxID=1840588 RepID=A0ACC0GI28_9ERIC|nr:hypothetical protein LOK49_LG09G02077 [Camellia lanceoleosa]
MKVCLYQLMDNGWVVRVTGERKEEEEEGLEYDEKVLLSIGNEVLKAVVVQFNADQLLTERPSVSALVRQSLVHRAKDFNIVLDDVAITHLLYGAEFSKAVEQKKYYNFSWLGCLKGSVNQKEEVPFSVSNLRRRIDPLSNAQSGGDRGFGLPSPSKFRSGHLSGVIPVSRALPTDVDDIGSASDNDLTTDSEQTYGGRYSLDSSSPQDDGDHTNAASKRYYNSAQRQTRYASDSVYSGDVSSSRETIGRGNGNVAERLMRGANRYPVGRNGYSEDDISDSAASSEFSSTQVGGDTVGGTRVREYVSEGHASNVSSQTNVESAAEKDSRVRNLPNEKFSDDDIPSAPLFCGSSREIKEDAEQLPTSRAQYKPYVPYSHDFSAKNGPDASDSISPWD